MERTERKICLAFRNRLALVTALTVAAVLFAACEMDPVKRADSNGAGSRETGEEVNPADQAAGVRQEAKESEKPTEPRPRLAGLLDAIYGYIERESDPKVHEWLVWRGTKMIADGKSDDEIRDALITELLVLKPSGSEERARRIKRWKEKALGINPSEDGWRYVPSMSKQENRIRKYLHEQYGSPVLRSGMKTPRGVIEILVKGMDDLTAAKYLYDAGRRSSFPEATGEPWRRREKKYAAEYADRVLAKDPASRDALIVKCLSGVDTLESARLLIEHHPNDARAVRYGIGDLWEDYPEEAVAAIVSILPEDGILPNFTLQMRLGNAYERLDMLYEAADQYQKAYAIAGLFDKNKDYGMVHPQVRALWAYNKLEKGKRNYPSIWEERAAAEAAKQTPPPAEASAPQRQPDAPASPDAPRGVEPPPPPPNLEAEMSAAYANFEKAYHDAFEMEYALSEATPEGYMNALLGMARAFAKSGDAQRAQDAYNAVRKRHSREEVERVFRRFDEQERLKRQPPSDDEGKEEDDSGEEE